MSAIPPNANSRIFNNPPRFFGSLFSSSAIDSSSSGLTHPVI
jgi:hypothetical protein